MVYLGQPRIGIFPLLLKSCGNRGPTANMTGWPNGWPSWRNSSSQRWKVLEPWKRRTPAYARNTGSLVRKTPACMNKLLAWNSIWPPPAKPPRPSPSRRRAASSSPRSGQPRAARSATRADSRDTRSTCGRPSRPRRSIISSPTRSTAGADCGGRLFGSRCDPKALQQVEITETLTVVTEHQGLVC